MQGPYATGKTSLGEAINRTLLGAGLTPQLLDYTLNREGNTYVDLRAELNDEPLRVELGYKCDEFPDAEGEGLRFTYADETVDRPKAVQTRAELSALLGVSPEVSLWSVFLDGERLKFKNLSQAAALDLLMQALNQPPWDLFKDRADKQREVEQREVGEYTAKLQQLKSMQAELIQDVVEAEARMLSESASLNQAQAKWADDVAAHQKQVQAAAARVTEAEQSRVRLKKSIAAAQREDAEEYGKLELQLIRLTSERRTAETYLAEWQDFVTNQTNDQRHARTHAQLLSEGKSCPMCRQSMQAKADEVTIKKAQAVVTSLGQQIVESTTSRDACRQTLREIDAEIAGIRGQQTKLRSDKIGASSRELETVTESLARAGRELERIERSAPPTPSNAAWQQAQTLLAERKRHQNAHDAEIGTISKQLALAERQLSITRYWCRGFSPEGIPNLVLRQTVEPLNTAARLISETLSGGQLRVHFSADTELASGLLKPKLTTVVEARHGAPTLTRHSKGEAGLINLIIAETQTQVGRVLDRIGYRWCDELLNHVGASVRQSVYSHLKRQATEQGLLTFVVDHHPEVTGMADHVLLVDKTADGLSTFRWQ